MDGFLTPDVADTRNPLVVMLHSGCIASESGGLTPDGNRERYVVNLLEEEPAMPSAQRMLEILAENPVAQAKFFIISMRLFLEHILGVMPFDEQLRANGSRAGVVYPDGAAADFLGGSFPAIQQLHGPIEEQARLSCHPHFVNRASQAWLRTILKAETAEAKRLLRRWQEKTLLAVESIMSSCAGTARFQFEPVPFRGDVELLPQPYSAKWQEEDRFDGGVEEDVKEPSRRRPLISVVAPVVDRHVRRHLAEETAASFEETKKRVNVKQLPLTGCVMARLPHYRLPMSGFDGCECCLCQKAREEAEERSVSVLPMRALENMRAKYVSAFCEDLRDVCALSGHLHEHKSTCFKYAPEGSRRKPQHCRFHFTHFVKLRRDKVKEDGSTKKVIEVVVARTGKEPLLPVWPQEGFRLSLESVSGALTLDSRHFAGRSSLGSVVETSLDGTQRGRVKTLQYNPREGQCLPAPRQPLCVWALKLPLS